MKKIKYIFSLLLLSIAVISCDNNINSNAEGTFTEVSEVSIGFVDHNDNQTILEDGGTVTFDVALSKALEVDAEVTMSITSSDGSLSTSGINEVSFASTANIPAGSTTASFTFTFADDGLSDNMEVYTVTIGNLTTDSVLTQQYVTVDASVGANKRTVNVADSLPITVVTTPADVDFNFSWVGNANDLDCRIRNSSGTTIDTGYSVSPGETVTLPQAAADGTYIFSIRPWTVASASISFSVDFVSPAGTETFNGTLLNATGFWSMEIPYLQIDKVTNGGVVTYTLIKI